MSEPKKEYPQYARINVSSLKWSMQIGDTTISHTTKYSRWRAFWLRFMGWKVTKLREGEADEWQAKTTRNETGVRRIL